LAAKEKGKPGISTCFACGCSLFFFSFVFAICLFSLLWFGFPLLAALRTKPSLPQKPKIAHADWKTLETKLREIRALASQAVALELTPGEFNAMLSKFDPNPCCGVVVHSLWMVPAEGKGTFFAESSGFWLTSLIFSFTVSSGEPGDDGFPVFHQPAVNRLEADSWFFSLLFQTLRDSYLSRIKEQFFSHAPTLFDKIEFHQDKIVLYGNFSGFLGDKGR
jgi:hypothetical protein